MGIGNSMVTWTVASRENVAAGLHDFHRNL